MSTIKTSIQMFNGMTGPLNGIIRAMNITISSFETMQKVSSNSIDTTSLQTARAELNKAEVAFRQVEESIRDVDRQQKNLNNDISRGTGLAGGFKGALAGIGGVLGIRKIAEIADGFALSTARLDLMNDGLQTTADLQNRIYNMAQKTGTSYLDTASTISKLGILAKKAFVSNNELLSFTDLANKSFIGSSAIEQSSAMYQLTQAMAAGKLQGDEYRSIIENAPLLAQSIEGYMVNVQKARGTMKDWSADGLLTANVIKNALFYSADEIEARFAAMPKTWGRVWNMFTNKVSRVSQPLLNFTIALAKNWDLIEPVVIGAAVAVGIYATTLGIAKGIQAAHTIATGISTAFNGAWTLSVFAQTAAQNGLNAAILACPITWIILAIIALIAIFYAVIAAINKWKGTSISATGIIFGYFYWMFTNVYNLVAFVLNIFIIFVNYLENAFKNPTAAAQALFYDMCSNVIGYVEKMAAAIEAILNKIPGVQIDITSGLSRFKDELGERAQSIKDKAGLTDSIKRWNYKDPREMLDKGYRKGADVANSISGLFNNSAWDAFANNTDDIAGNTGKIAGSMEISQEELKYLRDMAEREAINRFTTAEIKVDFKNESTINSNLDIDGVMDKFTEVFREAVYTEAEEVHVLV